MIEKRNGEHVLQVMAVIFIILLGILLRSVRLADLYHFTFDESVFAYVGRRMFTQGHIPLIGGVTPFHVHLAPYFYWISGILLYFGQFKPLIWGFFAIFLSFLVMILIYKVGTKVFGEQVSLLATIFYAFSFLINIFDRHYWGLVFNPLVTLMVFWALTEIVADKEKFFLLLAVSLAFGFHTDPSSWVLLAVSLITLGYFKSFRHRWAIFALILFLLSFLPLTIFDIRHQGVNIGGLGQYLAQAKTTRPAGKINVAEISQNLLFIPRIIVRTVYPFSGHDLAKQYAYCSLYSQQRMANVPSWSTVFSLLFLFIPFLGLFSQPKKKLKSGLIIIAIYFLSAIGGGLIYQLVLGGVLFDHYFSTAFVPIAYLAGLNFFILWKKNKVLGGLLLFLFILVNTHSVVAARHSLGYQYKIKAVNWVKKELDGKKFALESLGGCFKYYGYRYLFTLADMEPEKSYTDKNFFWLYDQPPAEKHPPTTVVFVSPAEHEDEKFWQQYNHFLDATIKSAKFGGIEVLIVDNRSGQYNGNY